MQLNIKALATAGAVLWGGSFLFLGIVNLIVADYGSGWLSLAASMYPGYGGPDGFGSVVVVTLWALIDGAVAGAILAWIYNLVAKKGQAS